MFPHLVHLQQSVYRTEHVVGARLDNGFVGHHMFVLLSTGARSTAPAHEVRLEYRTLAEAEEDFCRLNRTLAAHAALVYGGGCNNTSIRRRKDPNPARNNETDDVDFVSV